MNVKVNVIKMPLYETTYQTTIDWKETDWTAEMAKYVDFSRRPFLGSDFGKILGLLKSLACGGLIDGSITFTINRGRVGISGEVGIYDDDRNTRRNFDLTLSMVSEILLGIACQFNKLKYSIVVSYKVNWPGLTN